MISQNKANTMICRRFGKTELQMPVFTCGGMRYQQTWSEDIPEEFDLKVQENLEATVMRALELGICHIETARGYGSSEYQLGRILSKVPRKNFILQTKIGPKESADEFLRTFDHSMELLQLESVDLLSGHGINN